MPHHVTQRGNRRQATFFCDDDYQAYLDLMAEWCGEHNIEVWAYCLMPNHVHLIVVPQSADGLRRAIGSTHEGVMGWAATVVGMAAAVTPRGDCRSRSGQPPRLKKKNGLRATKKCWHSGHAVMPTERLLASAGRRATVWQIGRKTQPIDAAKNGAHWCRRVWAKNPQIITCGSAKPTAGKVSPLNGSWKHQRLHNTRDHAPFGKNHTVAGFDCPAGHHRRGEGAAGLLRR